MNLLSEAKALEKQIEQMIRDLPQTYGPETANARRLERALADCRRFIARHTSKPVVRRRAGPQSHNAER